MILKPAVNQVVRLINTIDCRYRNRQFFAAKTGKNSRNREITGKRQPIAPDHALVMASKVHFDLVIRMAGSVSI